MKRRWRLLGIAGLAGLVAVAFQPWRLAERTIEARLLAHLSQKLGVTVEAAGGGAFALLPTPRIIAEDIVARTPDGLATARIPRLRADIHVLALLGGRIEFDHVTLFTPQVELALGDRSVDILALAGSRAASELSAMPRISIRDKGSVFIRRGVGIISSVRDLELTLASRSRGDPLEVEGSATWRGEQVSFAFASNSTMRSTLPMARIRSDLVSLDFAHRRGAAASQGDADVVEGQIQVTASSASRLGSWLASGSPVLLPLGSTALNGTMRVGAQGAQVRNAVVTLGGDTLEGALDWRKRDSRWLLSGTFAGKSLDIGRPLAGIDARRLNMPDPAATAQLDIDDLLAHDIDIRLSLQRVRLPGLTLSDVAGQVMATEQRFDISVANASLYRGQLRGRASLGRTEAGIEIKAQVNAERVDLAGLSQDLFDARRLTGAGFLQHQIEMTGRSPAELLSSATGRLAFVARNGDFMGTNLNDAMRRIERQPLAVARDWRGGRTNFEQLVVNANIVNGVVEIVEARAAGPAFKLAVEGNMSIFERLYRLTGLVQSASGASQVPFDVGGALLEPVVVVNQRALLERSGAAAPLLQRAP